MRCYRSFLNFLFKDRATYEDVRRKNPSIMIRDFDELQPLVRKRKLGWFRYILLSSGLAGQSERKKRQR